MTPRLLRVVLLIGLWVSAAPFDGWASPSPSATGGAAQKQRARDRAGLIRSCLLTHRALLTAGQPLPLPESDILSGETARSKSYGDSWTCRSSTQLLVASLGRGGLAVDSSGKNAFLWGKEGRVSYHYYAVDDPKRPRLLVDPTAASNFHRDVEAGGLLRALLTEAARDLGQPAAAAEHVTRQIARAGKNGLVVLARPSEIAIYREALERAAAGHSLARERGASARSH